VVSWVGLDSTVTLPISEDRVAMLTRSHTVSGNPARFLTGAVPIAASDEWRELLPASSRRIVTAITLPLLPRYRYRPGG
jgi:hypothetical protein